MHKPLLTERLRYAFDNSLTRGPIAIIGWLALASLAVMIAVAVVVWIGGIAPDENGSLHTLLWLNLMRLLDAGNVGGDDGSAAYLAAMLLVTFCGIFVTSILIGTITSGIEAKLEELRKGRSRVIETNHTVILGWSEQIFSIISELVVANENQKRPSVAILADRDKVEMEDEIRDKVGGTKNTRVVCRRGSPIDIGDLDIVSIHTSRSIIILPPEDADPDSAIIKTLLAITNNPNRRDEPYHIVTEIRDPRNYDVARMVGRDEAEFVLAQDLVARLMAQTCRQSGLSVVYTELLDFDGDEIYFTDPDLLTGKTYGEAIFAFENSCVMGIVPSEGDPQLNPSMDTILKSGDRIVVITEDDDTAIPSGRTRFDINVGALVETSAADRKPERTLILGWNDRGALIIGELDNYVAPGSHVEVVAESATTAEEINDRCGALTNQTVAFRTGDTTDRRMLDSLDVGSFQSVIILCYSDLYDVQQADGKTLVTLLHLRDIFDRLGKHASIVSEMLDIRNRNLADVTRADDFIVSDKLISLMLSQVSENKRLNAIFADLFDPEGSEIYLKPADQYVKTGVPVNFYTVCESARRKGQSAIGYRIAADATDASKSYGVAVNPKKSDVVVFSERDSIVVLAED